MAVQVSHSVSDIKQQLQARVRKDAKKAVTDARTRFVDKLNDKTISIALKMLYQNRITPEKAKIWIDEILNSENVWTGSESGDHH